MKGIMLTLLAIATCIFLAISTFAQEVPQPPKPAKVLPPHRPELPLYITPEMEKEALEYLQTIDPERATELVEMKTFAPTEYRERIFDILRRKRRLEKLKKEDPERYQQVKQQEELERKSFKLAQSYRKTEDENEKARIKKELLIVLNELFDLREKDKAQEIKRLETQLKHLKETVSKRKANKDKIVQERLKRMLGEEEYLEW